MSTENLEHRIEVLQEQYDGDSITVSVVQILKQLKKYAFLWLLIAVVGVAVVFGGSLATLSKSNIPLTAMVGFSYSGIESGLDPNGNVFDANSIKAPTVIESTLTQLNLPNSMLDGIRNGLTVSGVVPDNAIDQITAYQSIFESNHSLEAAKQIMNISYYPTRFEIQFDYSGAGLDRGDAADLLNTLLNNYKIYFMEQYGFNEALGTVLTSVDYVQYDYPEAVDLFDTTLTSMQSYVDKLSTDDATRFRSTETGYTFADLQEAVDTLRTVDYASLSAYIIGKNVIKNKDKMLTYYQYQVEVLTSSMQVEQEQLTGIVETINNYQKDSLVILSGDAETGSTTLTQPSEAYDKLIDQKIAAQRKVSTYQQQINTYNSRIQSLSEKRVGSASDMEYVDQEMDVLGKKISALVEEINQTSDEYFETVSYANAYSVLVPASGRVSSIVSLAISKMTKPMLVTEAFLFAVYICFAVVRAFMVAYSRNILMAEAELADVVASETAEAESGEDKKS